VTEDQDERTIRTRRAAPAAPDVDEESLERTELSARRAAATVGEDDDTDDVASAGPRRSAPTPDSADAADSREDPELEDGSTVVARRESRRRATRAALASESASESGAGNDDAPLAADDAGDETVVIGAVDRGRALPATLAADVPAPLGRVARSSSDAQVVYGVRRAAPVRVERAAPEPHELQEPVDTAAAEAATRRRARRTGLMVVAAASALVVAVAVALAILISIG